MELLPFAYGCEFEPLPEELFGRRSRRLGATDSRASQRTRFGRTRPSRGGTSAARMVRRSFGAGAGWPLTSTRPAGSAPARPIQSLAAARTDGGRQADLARTLLGGRALSVDSSNGVGKGAAPAHVGGLF